MSRQIIKQPNGKYAIFSSILDNFLYLNITKEQYIDVLVSDAIIDIKYKVDKMIEMLDKGEPQYYQRSLSWKEALKQIEAVNGKEVKNKVLQEYRDIEKEKK